MVFLSAIAPCKTLLRIGILTLFVNTAFTTPTIAATEHTKLAPEHVNKAIANMVASPNSCQLGPREEFCEMEFHLLWETPSIGNYCLFNQQDSQPIHCWQQQNHGSIALTFAGHILENNKIYLLIEQQTQQLITSVTVPISGTLKQRQRAQRRRRGFWRMF